MYIYISMSIGTHVCMCMSVCACGVPKLTLDVFLDGSPCTLLRKDLSLNLWLASLPKDCLCLLSSRITNGQDTCLAFTWVLRLQMATVHVQLLQSFIR